MLAVIVGGVFLCGVGIVLRYSCRQAQAAKRLQAITLSSIGDAVIAADDTAMAARVLTKHGYTVLQAASGTDALAVLEQHPGEIHLLVSDVVMPGMDGRELADKVRERQADIRILFTSGYTEDAILHRGVEASCVAFLQKPYNPASLAGKIRAVLNSEVPVGV